MRYCCPYCGSTVRVHRTGRTTLTMDEHHEPHVHKTWIHPVNARGVVAKESVMVDLWKRCKWSGARVELP